MFNRKRILSFGKAVYILLLVLTLFLPESSSYSAEFGQTPSHPSRRDLICPGSRVWNQSLQSVWITIEEPVLSALDCEHKVVELASAIPTGINTDVEAIWVRCHDNELAECNEEGLRPFKLAGCYLRCFVITGHGSTLHLAGHSVCKEHLGHPEWKCGWVTRTTGWGDWPSPPLGAVTYDLDTTDWTCEGYGCFAPRLPPTDTQNPEQPTEAATEVPTEVPITGGQTLTPTSTFTVNPAYGDDPVDIREDIGCINGQYGWHDPTSGTFNVPDYMNDRTSCVAVDSGWSVMIYEHSNGEGGKKCLNHTVDDLQHTTLDNGVNANDVISSVQVFPDTNCGGQMPSGVADGDTITIHVDSNFTGTRWGVHDVSSWNIPDYVQNQVSSVGVVPGWSVLMYEHQNTTGGVTCIAASDPDLSDNFFNNGQPVNNNTESMRSFYDGNCSGWSLATATFTPSPSATVTPTLTPSPSVTVTPTRTYTQTSSTTPSNMMPPNGVELLPQQWHLTRSSGGSREAYQTVNSNVLIGRTHLRVTYDLHGLQALGGDASALIFDQNGWRYISLSNYGQNGKNGVQTVDIPLSQFPGLNLSQSVGLLHTRFWNSGGFTVDITSVIAYGFASATNTPTATFSATTTATQTMSPAPTLTLTSTPTSPVVPTATASVTPTLTPTIPSPTSTSTMLPTALPTLTSTSTIPSISEAELLPAPWHLSADGGASELYQSIDPNVLVGRNTLRITYDLHGLEALPGDASALIFDQDGWQYISLSEYGQNGLDGVQVIEVPLSDFFGLNLSESVGLLHTRFWYDSYFEVDIISVVAFTR